MDSNQDTAFTQFLREAAKRAQSEIKYTPTYFLDSLGAEGGYATVSKLLLPGKPPSAGFVKLWEHRRLDLSVEALILESEWRSYFNEDTLEVARSRLASVGYKVREKQPGMELEKQEVSRPGAPLMEGATAAPTRIAHEPSVQRFWRISGPPENFLVAIQRGAWALNESNRGMWAKIKEGDTVIFHSTRSSGVVKNPPSSILGFATVGARKVEKDEFWWPTEISDEVNHWPYTFDLSSICLTSTGISSLDLSTPFYLADAAQKYAWISALLENAIPISSIEREAKAKTAAVPNFPVNGSIAPVNETYRQVIFLGNGRNWELIKSDVPVDDLEASLLGDEDLNESNWGEVYAQAASYSDPISPSHEKRLTKVRVENAIQKHRVAFLEDFTCQVCGYSQSYIGKSGRLRWIIHVDHIHDKADGGGEEMSNLWALCPRCHMEKTHGVLTIDRHTYVVERLGTKITIKDRHLVKKA